MTRRAILALAAIALAVPAAAGGWMVGGHWDERECEICGKTVYVYVEPCVAPYMPSGGVVSSWPLCPGEVAVEVGGPTVTVCPACEKKYAAELRQIVRSHLDKLKADNRDLIEKHEEERRQRYVRERQELIERLQKEINDRLPLKREP